MKKNLRSSVIRIATEDVSNTAGKWIKEAKQGHSFDSIIPLICCVEGIEQSVQHKSC